MNLVNPNGVQRSPQHSTITAQLHVKKVAVSENISQNFSLAKVCAILTIVAGHWFPGTILWIPVTFGLFVFAFSSSYFTSRIYGVTVDVKYFWRRKLERLGLRYWLILAFLAVVIGFKGGAILQWHTLVHLFGLSGLLNWTGMPNRSGLGAGLWFFTLLLMFYITYPYLAKLSEARMSSRLIAIITTLAAILLESQAPLGHELWLTSVGFILGIVFGMHESKISATGVGMCVVLSCSALFLVNILSGHREFNISLVTVASISIALWLSKVTLPQWSFALAIAKLEKYLLEIFLIHTYLFVHWSGNTVIDFFVSVLLIVVCAMILHRAGDWLFLFVFQRKRMIADVS